MITPVIDKSTWGDGPWQTEPDRVDFVHAGFACMALRHERYGHWCGYVGVPKGHPLYEVDYDSVNVDAHFGLSYGEKCDGVRICHVPQPGMPDDVWWLGFDCGHFTDISPGMDSIVGAGGLEPLPHRQMQEYRDLPYVKREIEALAEQLNSYTVQPGEETTKK